MVPLINRGSTSCFVPPSVNIGLPLFVSPRRRSGQLSSVPWRSGWTVVSWANRSVGGPNCLALLRPATPPHAAPHRPARGMFGFWTRQLNLKKLCKSIRHARQLIPTPRGIPVEFRQQGAWQCACNALFRHLAKPSRFFVRIACDHRFRMWFAIHGSLCKFLRNTGFDL